MTQMQPAFTFPVCSKEKFAEMTGFTEDYVQSMIEAGRLPILPKTGLRQKWSSTSKRCGWNAIKQHSSLVESRLFTEIRPCLNRPQPNSSTMRQLAHFRCPLLDR